MNDCTIAGLFNRTFGLTHGVVIYGGAPEPLYLPASKKGRAIIRYSHDYASSALHEISHWCLAGRARRARPDYGYRYAPPPRGAAGQSAFFSSEVDVQAIEYLLSQAAGVHFTVSADDPSICVGDFRSQIEHRAAARRCAGLPPRAQQFHDVLAGARS
ncbi:MAG: elongation factor P hydroxylase [Proteobacteria bacterium]|nr:elongation factor P hydroxylase [Pseudomonadota bacterium]